MNSKYVFVNNCFKLCLICPLMLYISTIWIKYVIITEWKQQDIDTAICEIPTATATTTTTATATATTATHPSTTSISTIPTSTPTIDLRRSIWDEIEKVVDKANSDLIQNQYFNYIRQSILHQSEYANDTILLVKEKLSGLESTIATKLYNKAQVINKTVEILYDSGALLSSSNNNNNNDENSPNLYDLQIDYSMFNQTVEFVTKDWIDNDVPLVDMDRYYQNCYTFDSFQLDSTQNNTLSQLIDTYIENNHFYGYNSQTLQKRYSGASASEPPNKKQKLKWKCVSFTLLFVSLYFAALIGTNILELKQIQYERSYEYAEYISRLAEEKEKSHKTPFRSMFRHSKWLYYLLLVQVVEYLLVSMSFSLDSTSSANLLNVTKTKRDLNFHTNSSSLSSLSNQINSNLEQYMSYNIWGNNVTSNTTAIMDSYINSIGGSHYTLNTINYKQSMSFFNYPTVPLDLIDSTPIVSNSSISSIHTTEHNKRFTSITSFYDFTQKLLQKYMHVILLITVALIVHSHFLYVVTFLISHNY